MILVAFAAAVLWVEPTWSRHDKTLQLRVRGSDELLEMGRAQTRRVAQWVVRETARRTEAGTAGEWDGAPVGAPPPAHTPGSGNSSDASSLHNADEWITRRDQKQLDELILDKSRD